MDLELCHGERRKLNQNALCVAILLNYHNRNGSDWPVRLKFSRIDGGEGRARGLQIFYCRDVMRSQVIKIACLKYLRKDLRYQTVGGNELP